MGGNMNSPKGVKSGVPKRVSISCPTCGTGHDPIKITGNQLNCTKLPCSIHARAGQVYYINIHLCASTQINLQCDFHLDMTVYTGWPK